MPICRHALLLGMLLGSASVQAAPGDTLAVRWWGHAMTSLETHWGLRVVIDPFPAGLGYPLPEIDADLVLISHGHGDHNYPQVVGGDPVVLHGLDDQGAVQPLDRTLDLPVGVDRPHWRATETSETATPHALRVRTIAAWHDDQQGAARGATAMFLMEVDGLRILHCGDLGQASLTSEQLQQIGRLDVLMLPVGGVYTIDGRQAAERVRQLRPRYVVPLHYKTDVLTIPLETDQAFLTAAASQSEVVRPVGNTLAVRARDDRAAPSAPPVVVSLSYRPWQPPAELGELMDKMEASCRRSQDVFAKLSTAQMSFRPGNGTHTPRWNAEHMAGRELLFFSQIYAARNDQLRSLDANPQQMPADYQPAHPDWDGKAEARHMARTADYVRRFAYLLDGLPLDQPAPGSRWTLRGLLRQMERHYDEHTANVVKKFELPDWPAQ
jgi:L-ascorbate metabolism protein UlaG (beta-lactamase superfamily)